MGVVLKGCLAGAVRPMDEFGMPSGLSMIAPPRSESPPLWDAIAYALDDRLVLTDTWVYSVRAGREVSENVIRLWRPSRAQPRDIVVVMMTPSPSLPRRT